MATGILGGTFDPPHRGHLALARAALASGNVDRVIFIPAHAPPHKQRPDISPAPVRLAMTRLLADENPRLSVDPLELERGGPSFTIDTVRTLRGRNSSETFRLLVGLDMAVTLHEWREAEELLRLAPPLVVFRPGAEWPPDLSMERLEMTEMDVSSTAIRNAVRSGDNAFLERWLTPLVLAFVRERGLYIR